MTTAEHRPRGLLARLLRTRALHFMMIGGVLFALGTWADSGRSRRRPAARERIKITAADVRQLRQDWTRQYGIPPTPVQEDALIKGAIDDEVLHREALAMGLDRNDKVVRARLIRLARFLDDDPDRDDDDLARQARALGLERSDVVVRRYLIQMMRLLAAKPGPSDMPAPEEVESYYERHRDRFMEPARVRMTHVYLNRDRHGDALENDAAALLTRLGREHREPKAAAALGDPFIRGSYIALASADDLDRVFGPGFAAAVAKIAPRVWAGPVRSSYGLHLVWVHDRIAAHVAPLAGVRNRVVHELLRERSEHKLRANMRALRERYDIEVEGTEPAHRNAG